MLFNITRLILYSFFKLFFRFEVSGRHNIPAEGGAVIAANHISYWDPPVIGAAGIRQINYMAKEELFTTPIFSWVIKKYGAFPVKRGGSDRSAIRNSLSVLEKGGLMGIFPEGKRNATGVLSKAEPGVALIVAKAKVPVIPAAIIGTNKIFSLKHGIFPKVKVKFGTPLIFDKGKTDRQTLDEISDQIMTEISRLLKEN